ncbi:MAG TPA: AAA family ATPase [Terriglobia bacterium]
MSMQRTNEELMVAVREGRFDPLEPRRDPLVPFVLLVFLPPSLLFLLLVSKSNIVRHLERIDWSPAPNGELDLGSWPYSIPAVAQLIREGGLDIPPGVTILVGENGSGKSTLIEAFAAIYPRSGHRPAKGANVTGPDSKPEDSLLRFQLRARTHRRASPAGFFLRAEAMHEFLQGEDAGLHKKAWGGETPLNARSHGESFLTILRYRFEDVGVYFLDEPESALSFHSCLGLVSLLDTMCREGSQIIVATHSPLLASLPGATLLELGEQGIRRVDSFDDLSLVQNWRLFLGDPHRFLRHLIDL